MVPEVTPAACSASLTSFSFLIVALAIVMLGVLAPHATAQGYRPASYSSYSSSNSYSYSSTGYSSNYTCDSEAQDCGANVGAVWAVVGVIFGVAAVGWCLTWACAREDSEPARPNAYAGPPLHRGINGDSNTNVSSSSLPTEASWLNQTGEYRRGEVPILASGFWTGTYSGSGGPSQSGTMSMTVRVTPQSNGLASAADTIVESESELEGSGSDAVGRFGIKGSYSGATGQCSFTKRYIRGTGNSSNRGHTVEYRGSIIRSDEVSLTGQWFLPKLGSTTRIVATGLFRLKLPTQKPPAPVLPQYHSLHPVRSPTQVSIC
jgi:hypothetical protein